MAKCHRNGTCMAGKNLPSSLHVARQSILGTFSSPSWVLPNHSTSSYMIQSLLSNVITGLTSRLSLLIIAGHSLRPNWRYLFEGNPLINHPSSINPGLTLRWSSRLDPSQTVKPWFWHGKMTRRTLNERRSSKPMSRQCSSERRAAPSRACQNMSEEVFLRSFQNTLVLVDDFRGLYWVVLIPNPSQYGIKRD